MALVVKLCVVFVLLATVCQYCILKITTFWKFSWVSVVSVEEVQVVHDDIRDAYFDVAKLYWNVIDNIRQSGLSLVRNSNGYSFGMPLKPWYFFHCRFAMASSCTQLCLKCRGLLCSKTVASAWNYSTQLRHCTKVAILPAKILNGSSAIEGNHTTTGRQQWKQQMFCYSDLTAKHLATEAKESNDIEDLSRADVVAYKTAPIRDAVPVTESQTSFGKTFSFNIRIQFKYYF